MLATSARAAPPGSALKGDRVAWAAWGQGHKGWSVAESQPWQQEALLVPCLLIPSYRCGSHWRGRAEGSPIPTACGAGGLWGARAPLN